MKYTESLKRGLSTGSVEPEYWKKLKAIGIDCIEMSCTYEKYMDILDFPNKAETYAKNARLAELDIWSIHLPFSQMYDISIADEMLRDKIIQTNKLLIEAAGHIGIKTAVLHPSSEPIADCDRARRMHLSREAIVYLKDVADKAGIVLAIENLPRTCLCNTASEMIELLKGTGATAVFDTNHSLKQDNISFLNELTDAGIPIQSLHISDYDFVNERHRLPGLGINDWNGILKVLESVHYCGPLMYEIAFNSSDNDPRYNVTLEMLEHNMNDLVIGNL